MSSTGKFHFAIDRGGTFTDVWALCPNGTVRVLKLLSEDPRHYKDAPTEAIRRILQEVSYLSGLASSIVFVCWAGVDKFMHQCHGKLLGI